MASLYVQPLWILFQAKKNILVSGNAGDKKNLHPGGRKVFFDSIFRIYYLFFFGFFCFFVFLFFCCCLFVCFLKLKVCIQIHIRLCGRVIFTQQISTVKHLRQSLFLNKVAGPEHLQVTASVMSKILEFKIYGPRATFMNNFLKSLLINCRRQRQPLEVF